MDGDCRQVDLREIELGFEWYGEDSTDLRFLIEGKKETWESFTEFLEFAGPLGSLIEDLSEAVKEAKQSDPRSKIKCINGTLGVELVTKVMDHFRRFDEIDLGAHSAFTSESSNPATTNPYPAAHQQGRDDPETGSQASSKCVNVSRAPMPQTS
jgi:hypothetical protein